MLLAGWLVEQYMSDVYFRLYVDQFFAANSTYIILTLGVGGGSTVGALFLRRKGHIDHSSLSGLQKTKPFKSDGALHSPSLAASQTKVLPTGAPPTQPSKHTAYAVPPISKSSPPSSSSFTKSTPSSAWTAVGKQGTVKPPSPPSSTGTVPAQGFSPPSFIDRARPQGPPPTEPRSVPSGMPSPAPTFTPPFTRPSSNLPTQALKPEQGPTLSRQSDVRPDEQMGFPKWGPEGAGGMEGGLKRVPVQGTGFTPQPPSSQPQVPPQTLSSKWQAPDSGTRTPPQTPTGQWVSPVPRQPYNPPGRPGVPGGGGPGQRSQPPPGSPPLRPGQGPPPRPLFPSGQNTPRPLAYPSASRPMQAGPSGPGGFRPGLVITGPQGVVPRGGTPGQSPSPRPQQPANLSQTSDVRGPLPSSSGRPSQGGTAGTGQLSGQPSSSSDEKPGPEASSGAEMDWDTALDTILKTLRKDKVGEK